MLPALAAAAAASSAFAVTAGATAYATLNSTSQLFGRVLVAPPGPQQLALTFDDGPNPSATPLLLELLARRGIHATFFLIGGHARCEPALTREIAAAGHTIGNHTQHHPWLPRYSDQFIQEEIAACSDTLEDLLGKPVRLFRPPHGARRPMVLRTARELGMQTVLWNLIVGDWKGGSPEMILEDVSQGILSNQESHRGTNVVLHDGGQHSRQTDRKATVAAVGLLLDELAGGEMRFVVPPDWH